MSDHGMCYVKVIDVLEVGVHPENRDGSGLIIAKVNNMTMIYWTDGFNRDKVFATLIELPQDRDKCDDIRNFNARLIRASDGLLANTDVDLMKYMTVAGSHSTASCRTIKFAAKTTVKELADSNGCVRASLLLDKEPSMREPIETGLEYDLICYRYLN